MDEYLKCLAKELLYCSPLPTRTRVPTPRGVPGVREYGEKGWGEGLSSYRFHGGEAGRAAFSPKDGGSG